MWDTHDSGKMTQRSPLSSAAYEGEDFLALLAAEAILPEQFFCPAWPADLCRGERALMRAVLADAILCFQKYDKATRPSQRRLAQEAEAWFRAEDRRWPFSFVHICQILELDPDYIRMGLRRWRQQGVRPQRRYAWRVVASPGTPPLAA